MQQCSVSLRAGRVAVQNLQGELPMHDLLASAGRDTVKLELLDALLRVGVSLDVL